MQKLIERAVLVVGFPAAVGCLFSYGAHRCIRREWASITTLRKALNTQDGLATAVVGRILECLAGAMVLAAAAALFARSDRGHPVLQVPDCDRLKLSTCWSTLFLEEIMIGLSVSLCMPDIVSGKVPLDQVEKIVAGTRCADATAWDGVILGYRTTYWRWLSLRVQARPSPSARRQDRAAAARRRQSRTSYPWPGLHPLGGEGIGHQVWVKYLDRCT